jgi:uncharacterized membrane protein YeiH
MQQVSTPNMLHQITHFIYNRILEHTDFICAAIFTIYGIHISNDFVEFTFKALVTFVLGGVGAFGGFLAKIFIIHPIHKYLKRTFPKSKFFND